MAQVEQEVQTFAAWFDQLLEQADGNGRLSQHGAAVRIGVTRNTVQRWLKGTKPSYDELVKIFRAFGTLPPDLMRVLFTDEMEARSA